MIPFEPISFLQRQWLQEIGLERAFLMRLPMQAEPEPELVAAPEQDAISLSDQPKASAHTPEHNKALAQQARDQALALLRPKRQAAVIAPAEPEPVQAAAAQQVPLAADMAGLQNQIEQCQRCALHEGRSLTVFGRGEQAPDWLVVGEAPGTSDDRTGLPFDGQAGELLQTMLNSVLPHASFYMTNLVKCRPLGNRPPKQEELAACRDFLDAQINYLQPKRILAVGQLAARVFAQDDKALENLRGQVLQYRGPQGQQIPLLLSYHPASLLLGPQFKANAWRDLLLMKRMQAMPAELAH